MKCYTCTKQKMIHGCDGNNDNDDCQKYEKRTESMEICDSCGKFDIVKVDINTNKVFCVECTHGEF